MCIVIHQQDALFRLAHVQAHLALETISHFRLIPHWTILSMSTREGPTRRIGRGPRITWGDAYWSLGERLSGTDGAENLHAAVTAFQNALQVRTRESLPMDWGLTQNDLGTAYRSLGERLSGSEGVEYLRAAVTAFQSAFQAYTKESFPPAWAGTQNNLGVAYRDLGERLSGSEGTESLRAAVTAFQNALQIQTKASLPQDWAMTQNNLGTAYLSLRRAAERA